VTGSWGEPLIDQASQTKIPRQEESKE
jgi:hypothetical protein